MQTALRSHMAAAAADPMAQAFKARQPMVPWLSMQVVADAEVAAVWNRLRQTSAAGPAVAYVHVPFCSNHCLFCGFYRNASRDGFSARYAKRVREEIEAEAETAVARSAPVGALYLGGGTPTDLEPGDLASLIRTLRDHLPLTEDCEITVEGRAKGFTAEKIAACLEAGANRFSIGAQTFDTTVRRRLGRKLDGDALAGFFRDLLDQVRGRAAVVCDLICGLPGQTPENWRADLERCLELGMDGVDLYCLTVIPGSPLQTAMGNERFPKPAGLPQQAGFYRAGMEFFECAGWRQLSAAHWTANGRERNRYNLMIKAGASCHGYGSGAGGTLGEYNYLVAPSLQAYLAEGPQKPLGGLFRAGCFHRERALITDGFERGRLDLAEPGLERLDDLARPLIAQWEEAGLLRREGTLLRATPAGRFWHTNLAAGLHAVLDLIEKKTAPAGALKGNAPQPKSPMKPSKPDKHQSLAALRQRLARNPDGILEMLAAANGVTTREVVTCLPADWHTPVHGAHFAEVMEAISEWGDILLIVHTADAVFECAGPLPKGTFGRGFFNLGPGSPIKGHIRAERCAEVVFLRRPFMGKETCSVWFFNPEGEAMFKIFVARDETGALLPDQVRHFETLRASALDHTILRPGRLFDGPPDGKTRLTEDPSVHGGLTRGDLARVILECLEAAAAIGKTFSAVRPDGSSATK